MHARPTGVKTFVLAIGGSVLMSIASSGCDSSPSAQGSPPAAQSPAPSVHSPAPRHTGGHDGLTDQEYAAAVALARREVRKADAHVTSATAEIGRGVVVTNANLGYPCTSGKVLRIKLIGTFPHTTATGLDTRGSTVTAADYTVHAVLLTADAESGRACEESVQTGEVAPEPGATVLTLD